MHRTRHALAALALLVGAGWGLSACGEDTSPVCDDADQLRSSLAGLQDINIQQGMAAQLQTQLRQLQSDLDQLAGDASSELSDEVTAVKEAASTLRASVGAAVDNPSAAALGQVSTDLSGLVTAIGDLSDALAGTC